MSSLPEWIGDRIDVGLDKKLTQRHVVETMIESERPFFSIRQLEALVKPDVSNETVRNRLDELREIDVVAAETYPESITLYYVNYSESDWPLSPEGKDALEDDTPLESLSAADFLRLRNPAGIRTLVLAGFQLSLLLFCAGTVLMLFAVDAPVQNDHGLWEAAGNLLVACVVLLLSERIVRKVRHDGPRGVIPRRFVSK
ncbi:hypothetical protein [Halorussus aquaticus]|uniref:Uncharacterized protein n=1 Tax=Halorussus aquaticus TaxID=2953748 RepID=A0ABD5PYI5_9EURY|nr:hypothetical protein [Halorussus aquaticus]